jgi:hypothetical protein
LFFCSLGAKAFVLNFNSSGKPAHWDLLVPDPSISTNVINTNTHAIRYFLASDGYSAENTAAELNLVRAAFAQWQAVPGTYLKFEDAGLVSPPVDVNLDDDTNVVYWTKASTVVNGGMNDISGALGVAFTTTTATGNKILQADIVFNGVLHDWFTDFFDQNNPETYVEGVALHEIGHFIGLNHSPVGGATMLYAGVAGVNVQSGLSDDEIAAARHLYPSAPGDFGAVRGTITKNGSPVLGAAVFAQSSANNVVAGTVSLADGTYLINSLSPGTYQIRVAPLDDSGAGDFLVRGRDIASDFNSADTAFLPTTNKSVTVTTGNTNTADFVVTDGSLTFRITEIRNPTSNPNDYSWSSLPTNMRVGQSNYTIGVVSADLPTSGATLTITGDGLTLGAPSFEADLGGTGLNFISVPISVASNATPGLRDFIVQQGANVAYANGFLEIQPAALDYNFDGLDDTFQRQYFSLFTSPQAAPNADPDGDRMNNSGENAAGTNPTNAASVLKMLVLTNAPGGKTVRWQSVAGKRYQVSSRTNLTSAAWQNIGATVTAADTTAQYFDPTATNGMRYYRAQVLP